MRIFLIALMAGSLAACGPDISPDEQERLDEAAIAEVEANQIPPPDMLNPQTMTFADFERNDIFGMGCSFVPQGGGEDPIAVMLVGSGYMKLDDAHEQFAPDAGSAEAPLGTRVKYDSGRHSMRLAFLDGEGEKVGVETVEHVARLIVRDGRDRTVYDALGKALCGA